MLVAVVGAAIGVIGAVVVALLTASDSPQPRPRETPVTITSVTIGPSSHGRKTIVARGNAAGLSPGVTAYVAARPAVPGAASAVASSYSWTVKPVATADGPWTARVRLPRRYVGRTSVVAFTLNDCNNCELSPDGAKQLAKVFQEIDRRGPYVHAVLYRTPAVTALGP